MGDQVPRATLSEEPTRTVPEITGFGDLVYAPPTRAAADVTLSTTYPALSTSALTVISWPLQADLMVSSLRFAPLIERPSSLHR